MFPNEIPISTKLFLNSFICSAVVCILFCFSFSLLPFAASECAFFIFSLNVSRLSTSPIIESTASSPTIAFRTPVWASLGIFLILSNTIVIAASESFCISFAISEPSSPICLKAPACLFVKYSPLPIVT